MSEDWLLVRIAEVEQTALEASQQLAAAPEVLAEAVEARRAGVPLPAIAVGLAEHSGGSRRSVAAAIKAYEHAVVALRADVVRGLVDEEHIALSVIARRMGLSRQAVTRLYQTGQSLRAAAD